MVAAATSSGKQMQALLGAGLWRHSNSKLLKVYAKGRKSSVLWFRRAGRAADRGKSSQMIFLDTSFGKPDTLYSPFNLDI